VERGKRLAAFAIDALAPMLLPMTDAFSIRISTLRFFADDEMGLDEA
jgi:hypothetical protein